jgi:hypothetical protein
MKRAIYMKTIVTIVGLLLIPIMTYGQSQQATAKAPPVEQPLVREGDFAVELVKQLDLGTTSDEAEAESILGSYSISPRNGWVADYPVTPDIMGEIQQSVSDAVDSGKLSMSKDDALSRVQNAKANLDLGIRPYTSGEPHEVNQSAQYPETSVINNYYYDQGPPIVTYYAPPPDYYYLYSWVPYPFWWSDFWFPGFFILNDFHRVHHFHHRNEFISNHFNDFRNHRVHRIDPVDRFHGRTFAGIGAPRTGHFLSPGVRNSSTSIFNRNRISPPSGSRTFRATSGGRSSGTPSGGRTFRAPSGGRSSGAPSGGRTFRAPSGGRSSGAPSGGRTFRAPSGGRSLSAPSGGRSSGAPSGGKSIGAPSGGRTGSVGGSQKR